MNGTLDFPEYTECLRNCPELDLTPQEIITTALAADLNGDGQIDFEEFMKHFTNILDTIYLNLQLYDLLTEYKSNQNTLSARGDEEKYNKAEEEEEDDVAEEMIFAGKKQKNYGIGSSSF